jgi:hypothetical protein
MIVWASGVGGNNRQAIFFEDQDYGLYHEWLAFAAHKHDCAIHAYE